MQGIRLIRKENRLEVKIISKNGKSPKYATLHSAGVDLEANFDEEEIVLKKGQRALVPTGIFIELPEGYEAQVRSRSGLAIKHGIALVNGVGTIDADYRGELKVPLINLGDEDFTIKNGDRIAQMIIGKYERVSFKIVESLSETARGEGGFGHTGV